MFIGRDTVTIDDKGRMPIPARFRGELSRNHDNRVVVSYALQPEQDQVLRLYTPDTWKEIAKVIERLPNVGAEAHARSARRLQRYLLGGARQLDIDEQGRVLLPREQRDAIGIKKKVVLVGGGTKLEIWSAEKWEIEFKDLLQEGDQKRNLKEEHLEAFNKLAL